MKEELTTKMHAEFVTTPERRIVLKAGCVWDACDDSSTREEIEEWCELYGITYEQAMASRDYWLVIKKKSGRK